MTVDTDQKYQESVESAANMPCQMKQKENPNKVHEDMVIPSLEEVLHVYIYPLI